MRSYFGGRRGKEFKAHKNVLSEASPFFEKLLSSDMKESREGLVCLEMFSESAMRDCSVFTRVMFRYYRKTMPETLSFQPIIYSFRNLKALAEGALVEMLNTSNCISIYYFPKDIDLKKFWLRPEIHPCKFHCGVQNEP